MVGIDGCCMLLPSACSPRLMRTVYNRYKSVQEIRFRRKLLMSLRYVGMSIHVTRWRLRMDVHGIRFKETCSKIFFMVLVAGRLQMAIMTEGCKPDPEKHIPEIKKKHNNIIASLHPERANWSFYAFRSTRKDGQRVQRGTKLWVECHLDCAIIQVEISHAVTFDVAASAQVYGRFGEN